MLVLGALVGCAIVILAEPIMGVLSVDRHSLKGFLFYSGILSSMSAIVIAGMWLGGLL